MRTLIRLLGRLLTIVLKWVPRVIDAFHIVDRHLAVRPTSSRRGLVRPVRFEGSTECTGNWSGVVMRCSRLVGRRRCRRLTDYFRATRLSSRWHLSPASYYFEATEMHTMANSSRTVQTSCQAQSQFETTSYPTWGYRWTRWTGVR